MMRCCSIRSAALRGADGARCRDCLKWKKLNGEAAFLWLLRAVTQSPVRAQAASPSSRGQKTPLWAQQEPLDPAGANVAAGGVLSAKPSARRALLSSIVPRAWPVSFTGPTVALAFNGTHVCFEARKLPHLDLLAVVK